MRTNPVSMSALVGLVMCSWMAGCSSGESQPKQAAPPAVARPVASRAVHGRAIDTTARIPIDKARGVVVMSDAQRSAKAFENGLVGRPPPSADDTTDEPTAQLPKCPPEGCDQPAASVAARAVATDAIRVTFTCADSAATLVRTSPDFATLSTNCIGGDVRDTGLFPGTRYCYAMQNFDGSIAAGPVCATTLFAPYVFNGPGVSQAESDQMAATFDWKRTDPVATTIPTTRGETTTLYSMNLLVHHENDLYSLRGTGIHTQTQPLLPGEQADGVWDGSVRKAMVAGKPAGVWITAIVPGPVYNDIRSQAIVGIANGHPIGLKAMVFRRINDLGAAYYPSLLVSPLDPTFLGQQGIEFNGYSACEVVDGTRYCSIEQGLFGWLVSKLITVVTEIVERVVDEVRGFIGKVTRLVFGEVDVTVQLNLLNSDELFGTKEPTRSGWNGGKPLVLKDLRVRAYQGVAEFTALSDDNGVATLHVAKGKGGKICIDLENRLVKIVETFTTRRVCIGKFSDEDSKRTVPLPIPTDDRFANQLAAMTDAAEYLHDVMGVSMSPVTVLTGVQSDVLTFLKDHSYTPCMGRMPNLTANIAAWSAAATVLAPVVAEFLEFLNSYDIILDNEEALSRGVGVHEYGHAAMCELLDRQGADKASYAWAGVIVATLTQDASSEARVIAEGFADFLALQVVGGAGDSTGAGIETSRGVHYCKGDSFLATDCFEDNARRCETNCSDAANIQWATSLLQDTFDRIPVDAAEQANPPVNLPNDGSHWMRVGEILVPHHTSGQVSAFDNDTIQLAGGHLANIFSAWAKGGVSTLGYASFFGGLAQVLKDDGFDVNAACKMFAAHEPFGAACPSYVTDVYGAQPTPDPPPNPNGIRFAYALADQPTAISYTPSADFAFNGTGRGIRIDRLRTGRYQVTFDGLSAWGVGLSASPSVTAVGSSTITCSVAQFQSAAGSTVAEVQCWDNAGAAPADSPFSIMVLGSSVLPSPSAFLSSGGLSALPPVNSLLSWTSGRHPETVTHNAAVGDYNVDLGVGNAPLSAKLVTPQGAGGGERCNNAQVISAGLEVKCYDQKGAPTDGIFYVTQVAGGRPGQRFGFAFANNATAASYTPLTTTSFNSSGGAITITHPSVGRYVANFAGLQKQAAHTENVQVTALGGTLTMCNAVSWSNSADGLQVAIECRDGASQLVNARYEVMVIE
jgi:hypothetical protein